MSLTKPDAYKSINSSSLQITNEEKTEEKTEEKVEETKENKSTLFLNKVIEYRILTKQDETNDYYFIQYLATILDYIERDYDGCLTDAGHMSLAVNTGLTFDKLTKGLKIDQQELVRFCLNMTFSYAVCVLFKGMVEVYKDEKTKEGFIKQNAFPGYILEDLLLYENRAFELIGNLKKVMDTYAKFLEGKYRTIYNEQKHLGFYKQIFNSHYISSNCSALDPKVKNAIEMK